MFFSGQKLLPVSLRKAQKTINSIKYGMLHSPRLNSVVMIGCGLFSVVADVSDVKFVSNEPVNGFVSDFTFTGVVLTSQLTGHARNNNNISKYDRKNAMLQPHLATLNKLTTVTSIAPKHRSTQRPANDEPKHVANCVDSVASHSHFRR